MPRRTLEDIDHYPTPQELYNDLMQSKGWPYKTDPETYLLRDRALFALLYIPDLRVSEAIRLVKKQFLDEDGKLRNVRGEYIQATQVLLSKRKPGAAKYRDAKLPLSGERQMFTQLVLDYLETLGSEQRLFPWSLEERKYPIVGKNAYYVNAKGEKKQRYSVRLVGTRRAWDVINALAEGKFTQHWLRAFGYNYDYDVMDKDILAVSDKTKADSRSVEKYIRRRHERYKVM